MDIQLQQLADQAAASEDLPNPTNLPYLIIINCSGAPAGVVPGGAIGAITAGLLAGALGKAIGSRGKGVIVPGAGIYPITGGAGLKDKIKRAIVKATRAVLPLLKRAGKEMLGQGKAYLKKQGPKLAEDFMRTWKGSGGAVGMPYGSAYGCGPATIQPYPYPYPSTRPGGAIGFGAFEGSDQWGVTENYPLTAMGEKNWENLPVMYGA